MYIIYTNKFVICHIGTDGYYYYGLAVKPKGVRRIALHRLIMMTFRPVPNMENLVVNHINGIKTDNRLDNLEWCTYQENSLHAYRIGLMKSGEEGYTAKATNAQIIKVCELLAENKYTAKEIADITGVSYNTVTSVKEGYTWKNYSKNYTFYKRKAKRFSNEEIEMFTNFMINNPKPDNMTRKDYGRMILSTFGYDINEATLMSIDVYVKKIIK